MQTKPDRRRQKAPRAMAFTLALFRRHIREHRLMEYLGFIPDLHTIANKRDVRSEKWISIIVA
jgi:hypothetical protein